MVTVIPQSVFCLPSPTTPTLLLLVMAVIPAMVFPQLTRQLIQLQVIRTRTSIVMCAITSRRSVSVVLLTTAWLIQQYKHVNHATMIATVLMRPEKLLRCPTTRLPRPIVGRAIRQVVSLVHSSIIATSRTIAHPAMVLMPAVNRSTTCQPLRIAVFVTARAPLARAPLSIPDPLSWVAVTPATIM